jgi:hypothetical protein
MIKVGGLDFAPDELGIIDDDDQDLDTEITFPSSPVFIKDEVFLRVAALAGWGNVKLWHLDATGNTYVGTKKDGAKGYFISRYDRSVDAILGIYDEFGLEVSIHRSTYEGHKYWHTSAFPRSSISVSIKSATDENLAMALCKLLIAIREKTE